MPDKATFNNMICTPIIYTNTSRSSRMVMPAIVVVKASASKRIKLGATLFLIWY